MRPILTAIVLALCLSPGMAADQTARVNVVTYICPGPLSFNAIFSADGTSMVLEFTGHDRFKLEQTISGSGFRYAGEGYELHGKGDMALLFYPDTKDPLECTAAQAEPAPTGQP